MLRKVSVACAAAVLGMFAPQAALAGTTYNSAPADGFLYGTGNNYSPANAAVLTAGDTELALRLHVPYQVAQASDSNGVYTFALGSQVSYDWSIDGPGDDALITITNLGTGQSASFNPLCPFFPLCFLNDNYVDSTDTDLTQNSEQFGFLFFGAPGFDPNVNDTYEVNLAADGHSLSVFAQLGTGAVPEPATWAMMVLGFGALGFALRRQRKAALLQQIA